MQQLAPILILLAAIGVVIARLPKIDMGHSPAFERRRLQNWIPMGLLYAFLYMGRYNLTVAKDVFADRMNNEAFATIFAAGTWVYGLAFLVNGPLTDRFGGRAAILVAGAGSIAANLAMGAVTASDYQGDLRLVFSVLYGINMYFQSFGAVAIVKCNAPWFYVKERGQIGAIFGILISLGLYFAYDWGGKIVKAFPLEYVFYIPAGLLAVLCAAVFVLVRDTPGQAGFEDFHPGDASDDTEGPLSVFQVFKKMLSNKVILTIALIEFCSGFLRQAVMQWYRTYCKQVGFTHGFVYENWGMLLCCAGILGGVFAGYISDRMFGSRRGPVSAALYAMLLASGVVMIFTYQIDAVMGWLAVFFSMAVIGVHGMLSGTASMDFGGRKNTGVAVGLIDGFVYAGTGVMSLTYAAILPNGDAAKDPANWHIWPISLVPVSLIGLVLASTLWNARPSGKAAAH